MALRSGDIWLNKVKYDAEGNRIRGNVCLEVYLPSRGTCSSSTLISVPVRSTRYQKLSLMVCSNCANSILGQVWANQVNTSPPKQTGEVGLGMLGLANLLRRQQISYAAFGEALDRVNAGIREDKPEDELAQKLEEGIDRAARIAKGHNMVRAFAIAPTASCSYRSQDLDGFTCTPEIAPPIARTVDRDSGTFGVQQYEYGDVEIASEVGWYAYKRVADGIMTMLDKTGLLHGYSFNSWSDVVTYDEDFIAEWLRSPQTSLYYSLQVMGDVQDKSNAYAALSDAEVDDYLSHLMETKNLNVIAQNEPLSETN